MNSTDGLLWSYVALLFMAALALVASPWPKWAKGLVAAGATGLYFYGGQVLDGVWGWPSRESLPERFVLLATVVEEPSKTRDGALYLWVNALEDGKPAREPRAYRLPYSKELHASLSEGMQKARQGVSQMGTATPKSGPKGLAWLHPGSDQQDVKIRDLPIPQLPEK